MTNYKQLYTLYKGDIEGRIMHTILTKNIYKNIDNKQLIHNYNIVYNEDTAYKSRHESVPMLS